MAQVDKQRTSAGTLSVFAWAAMALLGILSILAALGWSDPIESEDWIAAGAMLVLVVALPLVLSVISYRATSPVRSGILLAGAVAWPALLYWILVYA